MKKGFFTLMVLSLLVCALAGVSQAWQGRMGGMGDPYGLVADESDFLIHPATIAAGEGIRFYGGYRFTYTGVTDWDVDCTPSGGVTIPFDMSGHELKHDVLTGAAFPLGPGRMGLFFSYDGRRGDFDGDLADIFGLEFTSDLDAFALRLLYGLPVGGFQLGGELGFAYRQEEDESFLYAFDLTGGFVNYHMISLMVAPYLPPFVPYVSAYWEIPFKAGVAGAVGPLDVEFAVRGGVIVSGDNTWTMEMQSPVGVVTGGVDLDGDIRGWRIGGDLWLRYPLTEGLSLPLLVRMDYQEKTRDGDGAAWNNPSMVWDYDNEETSLRLVVGGGLDKELAQGTRIAAGIYYGYLHDTADFSQAMYLAGVFGGSLDHSDYPNLSEHRVMVRFAGEHEFSPMVALRVGLEGFYGWATQDLILSQYTPPGTTTIDQSSSGSHWGIGASVGGGIKLRPITLEPFVNAGYQSLDLSGDGGRFNNGVLAGTWDRDDILDQWYIGGGFAILLDL